MLSIMDGPSSQGVCHVRCWDLWCYETEAQCIQSTSVILASVIMYFGYNGSFCVPRPYPMLYHCNYLGYTGLLCIGSLVTLDFSDIPQQLIFLSYTVFGKIMAMSQRLQCVEVQGAHSSERHEDCKSNLIAFCTRRCHGDLSILQFVWLC
jgi:hypothetical protein